MSAALALLIAKVLLALCAAVSGLLAVSDVCSRRYGLVDLGFRLAIWLAMGGFFAWLVVVMRLPDGLS